MDDFSPEQLNQLMALGAVPDKQSLILRQMAQADKLRNAPVQSGGMAGRVYVADPLGAAVQGIKGARANNTYKSLEGKYEGTLNDQTSARKLLLDALRRKELSGGDLNFPVGDT